MKILTTLLIWIFVAGGILEGQEPAGLRAPLANENILHALVRVGRAGSVALGIVQPNDGAHAKRLRVSFRSIPKIQQILSSNLHSKLDTK